MKIGYSRVSTSDQKHDLQVDALKRAGCERLFEETCSGASNSRPELDATLAFSREGDTIVVWKLDRLARSMRRLVDTLDALRIRGIGFQSLTENIDTTSASGMLSMHIFGALAEFERGLIRERTSEGINAARARGRRIGRPPALNENDLRVARAMLSDQSLSKREVACRLNVSVATLYRHVVQTG
ncbi:MAG: recombinase family protein [Hyphomonadaceae bacterium]|nr:recombinase family protein [Hyphomonadaceae bacterium]